jgi:hypothetical protein
MATLVSGLQAMAVGLLTTRGKINEHLCRPAQAWITCRYIIQQQLRGDLGAVEWTLHQ